ncbi:MAG: hypothetical protein J6Y54_02995 [Lentisphaeria bacterium]|nr:hypothetical protein [Lentisphaeria bacterium]
MSNQIRIGWGRRSINPGKAIAIPGQFHMRVSLGELNPVTVNALAIDNGEDGVIFVTADMVSFRYSILDIVLEKLKEIAPEVPGDKVIFSSTHTHAGPNAADKSYPCEIEWMAKDEALEFLSTRIAEAIAEAWKTKVPGQIAYGYGFATVGHSRRVIYLDDLSKRPDVAARPGISVDGHGKMYGNTNDKMFSHYEAGTDSFINLMYTFDMQGKLTGALINVPCPAQTNEQAWLLHAGFWNPVREKLRAKYGDIGIVGQCGAGGDLSPRQLHYNAAELRRYKLKYPEKYAYLCANPLPYPNQAEADKRRESDLLDMLRAEDISERICAAFDEVLEWAARDKQSAPELRHQVRKVKLERRMFPEDIYKEECSNYDKLMQKEWQQTNDKWADFKANSILASARARCLRVKESYETQNDNRELEVTVHTVKVGGAAFASNPFELFIDYMHRIQARSPFEQTFIVQLVADKAGICAYLATERAIANKGYSASPYCNNVSAAGGQQLVEETLKMLEEIK